TTARRSPRGRPRRSAALAASSRRTLAADEPGVPAVELLRLEEVRAGDGGVEVLRGVSVAVRAGEIASVIGANGAGQSTGLRAILGMVKRTAGSIRLGGREIAGASSREVLGLGCAYVPQGRCNFPAMTVEENLEMGAYTRGDAGVRGDIEALMSRFPLLGARRRERAGTLSGGQQQVLEMAIALVLRPRLLLVDESSLWRD